MTSQINAVATVAVVAPTMEVVMGELRERMEREMRVRNFSPRTVEAYVAAVRGLAKHYRRAPDTLSDEDIHRYLIHVREERKLSASTCQLIRCGLKFFYDITVRRPQAALAVPVARRPQQLPEILSREEVSRIIGATGTLRQRLLLMLTYGGGLRVSEVLALRPDDLDAERHLIHVRQAKGQKDRYTLLPHRVLTELARYRRIYPQPSPWLFPQRGNGDRPMDVSSAQKIYAPPSWWPRCASAEASMPCATPSPPICSRRAAICPRCSACSVTPRCRPRCATCT